MGRRSKNIDWSKYDDLLGNKRDADIAKIIGCSTNTVTTRRNKIGIKKSFRNYPARLLDNKEHESLIGEIRLDMGLTIVEFCRKYGLQTSKYIEYQNGSISPLYVSGKKIGKIKTDIQKFIDLSGIPFEDIFPRYACKLTSKDTDLTFDQAADILLSGGGQGVESNMELKEFIQLVRGSVRPREFLCIMKHIVYEYTLEEIADELNVTRERIRQIITKGLIKLRHPRLMGILALYRYNF